MPENPQKYYMISIATKTALTVKNVAHLTIGVKFNVSFRLQLLESLAIVIYGHVVKVYNNYASTLIICKVNEHFSFLPIYFP